MTHQTLEGSELSIMVMEVGERFWPLYLARSHETTVCICKMSFAIKKKKNPWTPGVSFVWCC